MHELIRAVGEYLAKEGRVVLDAPLAVLTSLALGGLAVKLWLKRQGNIQAAELRFCQERLAAKKEQVSSLTERIDTLQKISALPDRRDEDKELEALQVAAERLESLFDTLIDLRERALRVTKSEDLSQIVDDRIAWSAQVREYFKSIGRPATGKALTSPTGGVSIPDGTPFETARMIEFELLDQYKREFKDFIREEKY